MNKIQIIFDKNKKSLKIKKQLINKIKSYRPKISNLVIVIGGDGFMLSTLKKIKIQQNIFMELILGTMVF